MAKEPAVERIEKEVQKKAPILWEGAAAGYPFMETVRPDYPLSLLCRAFVVSRSGLRGVGGSAVAARPDDERLKIAIRAVHVQPREPHHQPPPRPLAGRAWVGDRSGRGHEGL